MVEAYPLYWPEGWKRTDRWRRSSSRFKTGFAVARDFLMEERMTRSGPKRLREYSKSPYLLAMLWLRGRESVPVNDEPLFEKQNEEYGKEGKVR